MWHHCSFFFLSISKLSVNLAVPQSLCLSWLFCHFNGCSSFIYYLDVKHSCSGFVFSLYIRGTEVILVCTVLIHRVIKHNLISYHPQRLGRPEVSSVERNMAEKLISTILDQKTKTKTKTWWCDTENSVRYTWWGTSPERWPFHSKQVTPSPTASLWETLMDSGCLHNCRWDWKNVLFPALYERLCLC